MKPELKLSDDQIEQAAKAACKGYTNTECWEHMDSITRSRYKQAVIDAAPFLQAQLAEPSEEETRQALGNYIDNKGTAFISMQHALLTFISLRNAALAAPPDPRRKVIEQVIERKYGKTLGNRRNAASEACDEIIEQLDILKEAK